MANDQRHYNEHLSLLLIMEIVFFIIVCLTVSLSKVDIEEGGVSIALHE